MKRKLIACLAAASTAVGCAATTSPQTTVTVTRDPSPSLPSASIPQELPSASATAPTGVGVPVRDESLEFTVTGVRRASQIPTPATPQQADGEYLIIGLTVKNVGTEPLQYFTDSQSLVIDGSQNPADILAAVYLDPQSAEYITPGLAIDIETPFDVPAGSIPESIVLSDITTPGGVVVSLAGVPISSS